MKFHLKMTSFNTLRPGQNGRHSPDDIFICSFLNESVRVPIKNSLKCVPKGPINNIPALVQIMAWRRPGDKPSSELMTVSLLTHICVTRPQWVQWWPFSFGVNKWTLLGPEMRTSINWLVIAKLVNQHNARMLNQYYVLISKAVSYEMFLVFTCCFGKYFLPVIFGSVGGRRI